MAEKNQTKSSGQRGGSRKGAGRKKGVATTKTREIADRAIAEGITPLEVMLNTIRAFVELANKEKDAHKKVAIMVDACDIAKSAAPYVHPRLAAIEHTGGNGEALIPAVLVVPAGMTESEWEQTAKG